LSTNYTVKTILTSEFSSVFKSDVTGVSPRHLTAPMVYNWHPLGPENGNPTVPHRWVGILRFAVYDLFSWGETALTTVEQVNRWLCQPAVIPITSIGGEVDRQRDGAGVVNLVGQ